MLLTLTHSYTESVHDSESPVQSLCMTDSRVHWIYALMTHLYTESVHDSDSPEHWVCATVLQCWRAGPGVESGAAPPVSADVGFHRTTAHFSLQAAQRKHNISCCLYELGINATSSTLLFWSRSIQILCRSVNLYCRLDTRVSLYWQITNYKYEWHSYFSELLCCPIFYPTFHLFHHPLLKQSRDYLSFIWHQDENFI